MRRVFFIADVRGYTQFTREHGDAAAAQLAARFADLARDAVEARSGEVIELRGDEALAVFLDSAQAVRAALELQATCSQEIAADPRLPLNIGIGIDVGAAVPVEDGFRGAALNMAARLCSKAAGGQVLVTDRIASEAGAASELKFAAGGTFELKGLEQPVTVVEAVATNYLVRDTPPGRLEEHTSRRMPVELSFPEELIGREREMRWLRGTWREVRRGHGRLLFVSGPSAIGKTRLAAELATHLGAAGEPVRYVGLGGAAVAEAVSAIHETTTVGSPSLLVVDDLDVIGEAVVEALAAALSEIETHPLLILALAQDPHAMVGVAELVQRADERGDGHRRLAPLDAHAVAMVARSQLGEAADDAPIEAIARASGGVPGRIHEEIAEWAQSEAQRRLSAAAEWLHAGQAKRSADLAFANNAISLRLNRLYGDTGAETSGDLAGRVSPYRGLAPFRAEDSRFFFGREWLVGELAARSVGVGFLAVIGASGSGKSSAVMAGLLPSLAAGLIPGSERWTHAVLRPGEHPLAALRDALERLGYVEGDLDSALKELSGEGRLVVVVDQLEEVFSVCATEGERQGFIDQLTAAAQRAPARIAVVVVLRADFYGECAAYPALAELVTANQVLVGAMSEDELRRAVELPARRAGVRIDSRLVDLLVEEVTGEPGSLPALSTAMVELWDLHADGWILPDAYELTGGVRGAVSRLAERTWAELTDPERVAGYSKLS